MRPSVVTAGIIFGLLFPSLRRPEGASKSSPASASTEARLASSWNAKSAAAYLDQRANWWMGWPKAARDHDTFCISCHTAVPYAISRSALRPTLGEQSASPSEQRLIDNVTKRVQLWNEVEPFYSDKDRGAYKTVESRGTESVLNALVLAGRDAQTGHLSPETRIALTNMWAEQQTTGEQKGAWRWLRFQNEPWEADDSDFYGAALAAIATGTAPENYRDRPEIQNNLKLLRDYLTRQSINEPLMNRVVLVWASAKLSGLLNTTQQAAILKEVFAKQLPDGGWSLPSLAGNWKRHDGTPQEMKTDGYATGLIAFVLQQVPLIQNYSRLKDAPFDFDPAPRLTAGLAWLAANQDATTGAWPSSSLNKNVANHISPETALFMNDAATAYAVLALTNSSGH